MQDIKITTEQLLDQHVKNKEGKIFQVLMHSKNPNLCFLRRGNKYIKKEKKSIRQGLVNGEWRQINEHELKSFLDEDGKKLEGLSLKLVKRIILAQTLIEWDDELILEHSNDNYFRNQLAKSNKECERIASKYYDIIYKADSNTSQNLMNAIDRVTTKLSTLNVDDYPFFENLLDDYLNNKEEYKNQKVYFRKIEE